jgi:hypothetical protein
MTGLTDPGDRKSVVFVSKNTLLYIALGCFIFSTLVFAVLFFLK